MEHMNIQCVDALIGFQELPNESIDCIITDPPYEVIGGGHGGEDSSSQAQRPGGMLSKNDGKIFAHNDLKISSWINECYRVLKNETHIYIMTNMLNLEEYMREVRAAGFDIHNLLIWEKNNATPNRWYMKNCEYIIFARKGAAKPINNCGTKTVLQVKNVKDKIHPTEKPTELLRIFIENSTNEGDTILDPFGGSMSTALAALQTNRKCISFEIDENYYNVGLERLNNFDPTTDTIITEVKKKELTERKDRAEEDRIANDICKNLVDLTEVEVPNALVQERVNAFKNQYEAQAKAYGISLEQLLMFQGLTMEKFNEQIEKNSFEQAKFNLVAAKVLDEFKLAPTKEEVECCNQTTHSHIEIIGLE